MDRLSDMKQTLESEVRQSQPLSEEHKWLALERKIKYERLSDSELGAIWDALSEVMGTQQSGVAIAVLYASLVSVLQQQVATLTAEPATADESSESSADEDEDEPRDRRSRVQRRAHKLTHQDLHAHSQRRTADQRAQYENEMRRLEAGCKLLHVIALQLSAATLRQSTVFENSVQLCLALIHKRPAPAVYPHLLKTLIRVCRAQAASVWRENSMAQMYKLLVSRALEDDQSLSNKIHKTLLALLEGPLDAAISEPWREAVSKPLVKQLIQSAAQRANQLRAVHVIGAVLPQLPELSVKNLTDVLFKLFQRGDTELSGAVFQVLARYCAQPSVAPPLVAPLVNALYDSQPNKNDIELSLHYLQALGCAYQALYVTDREVWTNKLPRLVATTMSYLQTESADLHRVASLSLQSVLHSAFTSSKSDSSAALQTWLCSESFTAALDKIVQALQTSLKVIYQQAWSKIVALLNTLARVLSEVLPLAFTTEQTLQPQQEHYYYLLQGLCAHVINLHSLHLKETQQDEDHVHMTLATREVESRAQRISRREQDELDDEIEQLLTPLVALLGIARYLTAIQFALPPTHTPRHCWLLPILRRRVTAGASLVYYHSVFVKQCALLYTAALAAAPAQQHTLLQLYKQSWALLPSFALESRDVVAAFPALADVLLDTLGETELRRVDIRPAAVQCLTILAHRAHRDTTRELTRVLAPRSAQVLSTLFNSFVSDSTAGATRGLSSLRNQMIQTIAAWLQIADQPLVLQIFKSVMSKFLTATTQSSATDSDSESVQSLIELLIPFIAYLQSDSELQMVFKAVEPLLHSTQHGVEKKAFKALMTLCEHHAQWVQAQLWTVQRALIGTTDTCSPSSKAMRLRTVLHVIRHAPTSHVALAFILDNNPDKNTAKLGNLMPEVTLALKETSVKVRGAAEKILDELFVKMIELHEADQGASHTTMTRTSSGQVALLMKHLIALLAARHAMMISAALGAFRILFKYVINLYKQRKQRTGPEHEHDTLLFLDEEMSDQSAPFAQQISAVPKMVISVLESPYKEVVASSLEVIKTLSTKSLADTTLLRPHLDYLLKTIFAGMTNDNREHFRTKIKIILERLMAKFGYEAMEPLVPRKHRKLLVNIRKALGRLDKKKKAKQEEYQKRHKEVRDDDTMIDSEATERRTDDEEDIAKKMLKGETVTPVKRVNHYETKLQEALERRRRYKEVQASAAAERGAAPREKSTWILEGTNTRAALGEDEDEDMADEGRVIDFLDPNANQYIVSTNPHKFTNRRDKQSDFELTEDGRMIIKDEDEDEEADAQATTTSNNNNNNKKRKRGEDDEGGADRPARGANNNRKGPAIKKQKLNAQGQVGDLYSSKYAAGDMKKPGRPDPYAYIKLDPKFLNKRRRHVAHQQFESIVKGAKRGAKTKVKRK